MRKNLMGYTFPKIELAIQQNKSIDKSITFYFNSFEHKIIHNENTFST